MPRHSVSDISVSDITFLMKIYYSEPTAACQMRESRSHQITFVTMTSFCSYARPAQPGPNRTRLCGPCITAIAGDYLCFGSIR